MIFLITLSEIFFLGKFQTLFLQKISFVILFFKKKKLYYFFIKKDLFLENIFVYIYVKIKLILKIIL